MRPISSEEERERRRDALQRGFEAELLVADRLSADGWTILAQNWRGGGGEIDLVATRDGCLRFVEVKLRMPDDPLSDDAVTEHKRGLLRCAALAWCVERGEPEREQAFLVAIVDGSRRPWAIHWIDDAFDG